MSMIGRVIGAADVVNQAAAATAQLSGRSARGRTEEQFVCHAPGRETFHLSDGWYDRLVNGLNRLPRPLLALGSCGLFVYAMADPEEFALRMDGLSHVPDALWWLLGAVVSFYFGAREAFYFRARHAPPEVCRIRADQDPSRAARMTGGANIQRGHSDAQEP